mmetsp:Transcript_19356/g.33348  ORF Transcript_19356/g.33348 Transcript_19356/m.33348 type:complete len:344 (+) Transcript_19356:115-1146(+)
MALYEGDSDPLAHEEWDPFWKFVDFYFAPVKIQDLELLGNLDLRPISSSQYRDTSLLVPPLAQVIPVIENPSGLAAAGGGGTGLSLKPSIGSEIDGLDSDDSDGGTNAGSTAKKKLARKSVASKSSGSITREALDDSTILRKDDPYRLPGYSYTQRLVAAMVDEGGGASVPLPGPKSKSTMHEDMPWFGPADDSTIQSYQRAMEERVVCELKDLGLVDEEDDDEVQAELRNQQSRLRDVTLKNRVLRNEVFNKVIMQGLKVQAREREIKRTNDDLDINYLERMIRKNRKNKRLKTKYQRILSALYPNYKPKKETDVVVVGKMSPEPVASKSVAKKKAGGGKKH